MTTIITVGPGGTRDHLTLTAAVAALPAVLADDYVIECYRDTGAVYAESVTISGITTTATFTLTIQGVDRHDGAAGTGIVMDPPAGVGLDIQVDNVFVEQIEVLPAVFSSGISVTSASNILIDGLICGGASGSGVLCNESFDVTVQNSVLHDNGAGIRTTDTAASVQVLKCYNNTIIGGTRGFEIGTAGSATVSFEAYNNLVMDAGNADYFEQNGPAVTVTNSVRNVDSDGTFPNAETAIASDNLADTGRNVFFTSIAGDDYTLQTSGRNFAEKNGWGLSRYSALPGNSINDVTRGGLVSDIGAFHTALPAEDNSWEETFNFALNAATGTQDISHTGTNGVPKAAAVTVGLATADGTPVAGAALATVLIDGYSVRGVSYSAADSVDPSVTWSFAGSTLRLVDPSTGITLAEFSYESWLDQGIRIDLTTASSAFLGTVTFYGGQSVATELTETTTAPVAATSTTVTTGFAGEAFRAISAFRPFDETTTDGAQLSLGVASATGQACVGYASVDAQASNPAGGLIVGSTALLEEVSTISTARVTLDNIVATGYDLTTAAFANSTETAVLAMTTSADKTPWAGVLTVDAGEIQGYLDDGSLFPSHIHALPSLATAVDTVFSDATATGSAASAFSITEYGDAAERTIGVSDNFASTGTSTTMSVTDLGISSLYQDGATLTLEGFSAAPAQDGVWVDYTTAPVSTLYWPALVMGTVVVPTLVTPSTSEGELVPQPVTVVGPPSAGSSTPGLITLGVVTIQLVPPEVGQTVNVVQGDIVVDVTPLDSDLIPQAVIVTLDYEVDLTAQQNTFVLDPQAILSVDLNYEVDLTDEQNILVLDPQDVGVVYDDEIDLTGEQVLFVLDPQDVTPVLGTIVNLDRVDIIITLEDVSIDVDLTLTLPDAVTLELDPRPVTATSSVDLTGQQNVFNLDPQPVSVTSFIELGDNFVSVVLDPQDVVVAVDLNINLIEQSIILDPQVIDAQLFDVLNPDAVTIQLDPRPIASVDQTLEVDLDAAELALVPQAVSVVLDSTITISSPVSTSITLLPTTAEQEAQLVVDVNTLTLDPQDVIAQQGDFTFALDVLTVTLDPQDITAVQDGSTTLSIPVSFPITLIPVIVAYEDSAVINACAFNLVPQAVSAEQASDQLALDTLALNLTPVEVGATRIIDFTGQQTVNTLDPQDVSVTLEYVVYPAAEQFDINPVQVGRTGGIDSYHINLDPVLITMTPISNSDISGGSGSGVDIS